MQLRGKQMETHLRRAARSISTLLSNQSLPAFVQFITSTRWFVRSREKQR